jgi:hypothetical protein
LNYIDCRDCGDESNTGRRVVKAFLNQNVNARADEGDSIIVESIVGESIHCSIGPSTSSAKLPLRGRKFRSRRS